VKPTAWIGELTLATLLDWLAEALRNDRDFLRADNKVLECADRLLTRAAVCVR
jgi:hypothetical protein